MKQYVSRCTWWVCAITLLTSWMGALSSAPAGADVVPSVVKTIDMSQWDEMKGLAWDPSDPDHLYVSCDNHLASGDIVAKIDLDGNLVESDANSEARGAAFRTDSHLLCAIGIAPPQGADFRVRCWDVNPLNPFDDRPILTGATGLTWDGQAFWISYESERMLRRHDRETLEILAEIGPLSFDPWDLAWKDGYLWVANKVNGLVRKFDPLSGHLLEIWRCPWAARALPAGLAWGLFEGEQVLWCADLGTDQIYAMAQCDPESSVIQNGDFSSGLSGWIWTDSSEQSPGCPDAYAEGDVSPDDRGRIHAHSAHGRGRLSQAFSPLAPTCLSFEWELYGYCGGLSVELRSGDDSVLRLLTHHDSVVSSDTFTTLVVEGQETVIKGPGDYLVRGTFHGLFDHDALEAVFTISGIADRIALPISPSFSTGELWLSVDNNCCDGRTDGYGFFDNVVLIGFAGEEGPARIDIRPGACPNLLNPRGHGFVPVAVVGTAEFDVTMVDLASVRLSRADGVGGSVAPHEGPPGPHSVFQDVATPFEGEPCDCHELEGDGIDDLCMKFKTDELVSALGLDALDSGALVELAVRGNLTSGLEFIGKDCVKLVPRKSAGAKAVVASRACEAEGCGAAIGTAQLVSLCIVCLATLVAWRARYIRF